MVGAMGTSVRGYEFIRPSTLDDEEKQFVFDGLFPVGLDAFTHEANDEFAADVREHVFNCDHLLVLRSDGTFTPNAIGAPRPIAFMVWSDYETENGTLMYLGGMCVRTRCQGHGIGRSMLKSAVEKGRYTHAFMVTQNPVMKETFDRATERESKPRSSAWRWEDIGCLCAEKLGKTGIYHPLTSILRRNYSSPLYKELPTSKNWKYNELFAQLNREEGDAFLCYTEL